MLDAIFVIAGIALFVVGAGYTYLCERL